MKKENSLEAKKMEESDTASKVCKFDPYQASLQFEEEEICKRSEAEEKEVFSSICIQLRELMKEIVQIKNAKSEHSAAEIEERKIKGLMMMLSLRRLSRIQKVRVKEAREKSSEFRQGVDGITLRLQNLLYEVSHLKKEVRKCLEFQSADTEIDLVPIDQFYLEAPENISRPEETVEDAHQQRLAQLHWELEQRRGQTQLSDRLTQEKDHVANTIREMEGKLASLIPRIKAIVEATEPLQKSLNLPLNAKREQQKISELLPAPLYTLWVQCCAYGEACDSNISSEIVGDVEAAKKLVTPEEDSKTEASDSEAELELLEDNIQRKSRLRNEKRNQETDDNDDASLKQLTSLHPLHIIVTVKTKEENAILIEFYYAQTFRIVTVKCSLELSQTSKPLLVDVLDGYGFLNLLFPEDTGLESPNPANYYQLQKVKLSGFSSEVLRAIGKPYKWVQTLSGLSFMSSKIPVIASDASPCTQVEEKESEANTNTIFQEENFVSTQKQWSETLSWKVSAEHMRHTIMAIRRRLQSRLALYSQFLALESATSTSCIPLSAEVLQQLFPGKVCSELRSWKPIPYEEFCASRATQHFMEIGLIDHHHLTFKAVIQRQSVNLEAFVAISPDYPIVAPVFGLLLLWNKEETALSNPHVRQLEAEVNAHYAELFSNNSERMQLLSLQLYRLAMCLDILTEATSIQTADSNPSPSRAQFHKEKIFFRPARGPDRSLPFKYLPKLGVFAQR